MPGLFASEPSLGRPFAEQPVEYQTFGGQRDPLRCGKGSVRVREGTLILHGRRRRLFALRKEEECIEAQDIYDVVADGRLLRFRVEGRADRLPRLLCLANPETARRLAACLPDRATAAGAQARHDAKAFARFLVVRGAPLVTLAIIALNLAAYVVGGVKGAGWMTGNAGVLYELGGNLAPATALGQWWRLVTAMFLHAGLLHLAFNMWALWDAGRVAERLFGAARFATIYLAAGLLGGIASINWQQDLVGVGASGAVFGVYGALVVALAVDKEQLPMSVARQLMVSACVFIAYSLFNGFASTGIDNAAHLGGLLAGGLLGAGLIASTRRVVPAVVATIVLLGVGAARAIEVAAPVRDELAFRDFLVAFAPEETRLNDTARKLFSAAASMPPGELALRLDRDIVPGWKAQQGRIAALANVTPRSREVRDPLAQFIKLKLDGLEALRDGLNHNDRELIAAADAKLKQANRLVEEMNRKAAERKGGKGGGQTRIGSGGK
jgi:rhomboid protease GluP